MSQFWIMLGDKPVTYYDTLDEAEAGIEWHIRTYRETSEPLTVREVRATEREDTEAHEGSH